MMWKHPHIPTADPTATAAAADATEDAVATVSGSSTDVERVPPTHSVSGNRPGTNWQTPESELSHTWSGGEKKTCGGGMDSTQHKHTRGVRRRTSKDFQHTRGRMTIPQTFLTPGHLKQDTDETIDTGHCCKLLQLLSKGVAEGRKRAVDERISKNEPQKHSGEGDGNTRTPQNLAGGQDISKRVMLVEDRVKDRGCKESGGRSDGALLCG